MPQVFIVFLRRPSKGDARRDPFWEFGSFGCTRCHRHNLLHPSRCRIRDGDRLAFVQGGPLGCRLLLVTPPVKTVLHSPRDGDWIMEIRWKPVQKPFRYGEAAPLLAGDAGKGPPQFPKLTKTISNAARTTLAAKFASCFRARSRALEDDLALEIVTQYNRVRRRAPPDAFIKHYTDALPWFDPNAIPVNRRDVYIKLLKKVSSQRTSQSASRCGKSHHATCRQ